MTFWPRLFLLNSIILWLYVLDQILVVMFLLLRRSAQRYSERPVDHVIALISAMLPLLAVPPSQGNLLPLSMLAVCLLTGIVLHLGAKLSLRRSFGVLPADRGVKSRGMYRFVRHPMYLGYILVQLSLVLAGPLMWNICLFIVSCVFFALRISAEERLLGHSPDYQALCRTTRYRLIPGVY